MDQYLSYSFTVDQPASRVFDMISKVQAWWSEDFTGSSARVGDEFEVRFADVHYSKHQVIELVPARKVVWLTVDSNLSFLQQKNEWNGTKVIFEINEAEGKTNLLFTHEGLTLQSECYKDCANGWLHYLQGSLIPFITTGKANPNVLATEIAEKQSETSNESFNVSFSVNEPADKVYHAIKNMLGWWSQEVTGSTDNVGDTFNYHYRDVHICAMVLTDDVPHSKLRWKVTENHFKFTEDQTEWLGTYINFDINEDNGGTTVQFTHEGLLPGHECYPICHDAWMGYITKSLPALITTGKGEPNPKE